MKSKKFNCDYSTPEKQSTLSNIVIDKAFALTPERTSPRPIKKLINKAAGVDKVSEFGQKLKMNNRNFRIFQTAQKEQIFLKSIEHSHANRAKDSKFDKINARLQNLGED